MPIGEQQHFAIERLKAELEDLGKTRVKVEDLHHIDRLTKAVRDLVAGKRPHIMDVGVYEVKAATTRRGPTMILALQRDQDEWVRELMKEATQTGMLRYKMRLTTEKLDG